MWKFLQIRKIQKDRKKLPDTFLPFLRQLMDGWGSPRAEQKNVETPPTRTPWLIGFFIISGGSKFLKTIFQWLIIFGHFSNIAQKPNNRILNFYSFFFLLNRLTCEILNIWKFWEISIYNPNNYFLWSYYYFFLTISIFKPLEIWIGRMWEEVLKAEFKRIYFKSFKLFLKFIFLFILFNNSSWNLHYDFNSSQTFPTWNFSR